MVKVVRVERSALRRISAKIVDLDGYYSKIFGDSIRIFTFDAQDLIEALMQVLAKEGDEVYVFSYETIAALLAKRFGRGYKTKMANLLRLLRALECASGARFYIVRFSEKASRNDPEDLALADSPCP